MKGWSMAGIVDGARKHAVEGILDAIVVALAYFLATGVRLGGRLDAPEHAEALVVATGAGVVQVVVNILFDLYWRDWAVAALEDLVALIKASVLIAAGLLVLNLVSDVHAIPNSAILPGLGLVLLGEGALKLRPRWRQIVAAAFGAAHRREGAIIVGAGRTGQLLARDLSDGSRGTRVVCFVDDDPKKRGTYVRGVRVEGSVDTLDALIARHRPAVVVVAVPDAPAELVRRVLARCRGSNVRVRAIRGFEMAAADRSPLRQLDIDDLLLRAPVTLDTPDARAFLTGKRVLVTGAAGSIGSELARRCLEVDPARLLLLDSNESGLHDVLASLGAPTAAAAEIVLADVRDGAQLARDIAAARPQVIFHAAAYKHVPILERQPLPALATNVIGTANLLAAADAAGVGSVVFISSDKAVSPTNVLGLTKRFGELLTVAYARERDRPYAVVRFGNVLGSAGSVVPIFTRQIDQGGPITVTHADTTRYFMTIPEAAGLVIRAAAIAKPGDLLLLDMGDAVPIVELARTMIWLRGLRTPDDIAIEFTGMRPGEKLHEELWLEEERPSPTSHERVLRAGVPVAAAPLAELLRTVDAIRVAVARGDADSALNALRYALRGSAVPA
jgi:FlaA1/EpsC-like NDP-sugar epimerase